MLIINQTSQFRKWFKALKDLRAKAKIAIRLQRAENGNWGDCKSVGEGVFEMRITESKGYRIYYARQGDIVYLLLNGGNKSTQTQDIASAKVLWAEINGGLR
ncbi:type II toxin-antitoxin system RelE/ParE family toxin [Advenella mimigardefordensis]|uniref:Putative addiction module killer protein n=1 Tax=Advenella mimigardefordensis (strain DSM 17166 / LMG 22922 / DPN7) TaxID=1247726 RepID=W0PGS7_ADVMD|nr:type II toxin-antitoxin system RelE/ParE family toxin [Advenella mimigardefordensis]AHG64982.1 putative addiction module killer protein [Advenella mimigardefordensis DPN7]